MSLRNCPCKDCGVRTEDCHCKCESYKEWSERNVQKREAERKDREVIVGLDCFTMMCRESVLAARRCSAKFH